jgi:cold shock CspA family protein
MIGTIKLFNEQNCDGCVMADDGGVMFFHRACVEPGYQPKVGDRVTFSTRASPRTGSLEAYRIAPLVKSAA